MIVKCKRCDGRLLSHTRKLHCSVCSMYIHYRCVPELMLNDFNMLKHDNEWICHYCSSNLLPFNHFDQKTDFINSVSELWNTIDINFSVQELDNLCFNPFELNDSSEALPLYDIDFDVNYFNEFSSQLTNSNSYIEDTFQRYLRKNKIDSKQFSLMHLNIRSIPRHFSEFTNYIDTLDHSFTIYAFSETWFNDSNAKCYSLNDYNVESNYRQNRVGGGVSLFVQNYVEH